MDSFINFLSIISEKFSIHGIDWDEILSRLRGSILGIKYDKFSCLQYILSELPPLFSMVCFELDLFS